MRVESDYGSTRVVTAQERKAARLEAKEAREQRAAVRSVVSSAPIDLRTQGDVAPRDARHAVKMLERMPVRAERMLDRTGGAALIIGSDVEMTDTRPLSEFTPDLVPRRGAAWKGVAVMDAEQNRTGDGHGSRQGLLHEVGHVLDATMALKSPPSDRRDPWVDREAWESARDDFTTDDIILDGTLQGDYYVDGVEWFAEAFARYSASPELHAELEREAPATFEYMQATFGKPRFRDGN